MSEIEFTNKYFGDNKPVFIIAEAGINHDGSLEKAKELVEVAISANADAVKFQTFSGENLASKDAFLAQYHKKGSKKKETLKGLLKRLELKDYEVKELFEYCRGRGILCFSTPFGPQDVELLENLDNPLYKIASFSLTNYPLLKKVAETTKPIIMSTGLHTLGEVEEAVEILRNNNSNDIALLQCTSHYPSHPIDANLKVMNTLRSAFDLTIGYSDHTMGIIIASAAVAMGAKIIEKHFTLDVNHYGVDHDASLNPEELKSLVQAIREVELAMGSSVRNIPEIEHEIQKVHRPSIVSKSHIRAGEIIEEHMLTLKKPGTGIHPRDIHWVIGKKAKNNIERDRIINKSDLI